MTIKRHWLSLTILFFAMLALAGPATDAGFGMNVEADLAITKLRVVCMDEKKVEFCYVITNLGTEPVKLDGVIVSAALSADEHHDAEDTDAGSQTLGHVLKPGDSIQCCCTAVAVIDLAKAKFLVVTVDVENKVKESNKENNSGSAPLKEEAAENKPAEPAAPIDVPRPYPSSSIIVKAPPSQTIIFEPAPPPTFVFLPQTITAPRVIYMQKPSAPRIYVIGGGEHHGLQIPPDLLAPKPPCICIPIPGALKYCPPK